MNDAMLGLLHRSFDGGLTPKEQALLDEALAASEDLRIEHRRIQAIRARISRGATDTFKPFFTTRVMARIAKAAEQDATAERFFGALSYAFRRVALAGVLIIAGFIIYNIAATDEISFTTVLGAPEISIDEVFEPPTNPILEDLS
jgi:anti-sigma factor RsiW